MLMKDYSFRDLYKQFFLVKGGKLVDGTKETFLKYNKYTPPTDVDACLGYCYIDSQAGISFHLLCFANFDNENIDMDSYVNQVSTKSWNLFRYNPIFEIKKYTGDISAFAARIQMINTNYHTNESILPTRNITEIDHLRHDGCPDDIRVFLSKKGLGMECPWVRLTEIKENQLFGQLLNEPLNDFGVHSGDIVKVDLTFHENQIYAVVDV